MECLVILVFAILEPLWYICMVDSDNRKASFLDTFINKCAIYNASIVKERAEDLGHDSLEGIV